jgi:hypothetical protein
VVAWAFDPANRLRIPVTGPDRSPQQRINEGCHQTDGVGVTTLDELFETGTGDERGPCLPAFVPQTNGDNQVFC